VAFNPKTIAVVGASTKPQWMGGTTFIANLQQLGFPGRIYPINPKAEGMEIRGLKAYPSLVSVPEPIDLVIVSTPAAQVPSVLEDCIAANARNIHIFTAGFDETGEEEGKRLGAKIREIAQRGGLRIVGPNCMGLHVPKARISTLEQAATESGPVAFLSQSGGHAGQFVGTAPIHGIHFSKVISFGNALTLDSTDFLEYLATDPETKIITMYLEGVKDGGRLTRLVKEINPQKPVIIWKGGLTESGGRAVASHTGSLGGTEAIWDGFFKQTGAVRVDSLEELTDVTMTFLYLSHPPKGRRVALMGAGGGNSVAGADVCSRAGLEMPTLTEETRKILREFIPPEGTIIRNPLDIGMVLMDITLLERALEPIASDPLIDAIIFALPIGLFGMRPGATAQAQETQPQEDVYQRQITILSKFSKGSPHRKPVVVVLQLWRGGVGGAAGQRARLQAEFIRAGIPAYPSLERASRALAKFIQYHEFQGQLAEGL